jgi:hypothetical protein
VIPLACRFFFALGDRPGVVVSRLIGDVLTRDLDRRISRAPGGGGCLIRRGGSPLGQSRELLGCDSTLRGSLD